MVALCLVLLCGMAAMAVDLGFGFRERRFDQAGADAALVCLHRSRCSLLADAK
jgi:hypothetical protein